MSSKLFQRCVLLLISFSIFVCISCHPSLLSIKPDNSIFLRETVDSSEKFTFHLSPKIIQVNSSSDKTKLYFTVRSSDGSTFYPKAIIEYNLPQKNGEPSIGRHRVSLYRQLPNSPNIELCINYTTNYATWYPTFTGMIPSNDWPLLLSQSTFEAKPFLTGSFGPLAEPLFLVSDRYALRLDASVPLAIRHSFDNSKKGKKSIICMSSTGKSKSVPSLPQNGSGVYEFGFDFIFENCSQSICSNQNLLSFYKTVFKPQFPKPTALPDFRLFTYPIWTFWTARSDGITQEKVLDFAWKIGGTFDFPASLFEIPAWESANGSLEFDPTRFPNPKQMIHKLTSVLGHRVALQVTPYVNQKWASFDNYSYLLIKSIHRTIWEDSAFNGILDLSRTAVLNWTANRLEAFRSEMNFTAYTFLHGEASHLGGDVDLKDDRFKGNVNLFSNSYAQLAAKLGLSSQVQTVYQSQNLPLFLQISITPEWTSKQGLESLIPTVLTASLAGSFFIVPQLVPHWVQGHWTSPQPNDELYIRFLQASALLPAMKITIPPWAEGFTRSTQLLAEKFINLHVTFAPKIIALARESLGSGMPIIRPLWMFNSVDEGTLKIVDQFMLGEDIMVAPVLKKGAIQREVYLPRGQWIDQRGKAFTGPARITVEAPLDTLPFFTLFER